MHPLQIVHIGVKINFADVNTLMQRCQIHEHTNLTKPGLPLQQPEYTSARIYGNFIMQGGFVGYIGPGDFLKIIYIL